MPRSVNVSRVRGKQRSGKWHQRRRRARALPRQGERRGRVRHARGRGAWRGAGAEEKPNGKHAALARHRIGAAPVLGPFRCRVRARERLSRWWSGVVQCRLCASQAASSPWPCLRATDSAVSERRKERLAPSWAVGVRSGRGEGRRGGRSGWRRTRRAAARWAGGLSTTARRE